jgi:hypothetical protein
MGRNPETKSLTSPPVNPCPSARLRNAFPALAAISIRWLQQEMPLTASDYHRFQNRGAGTVSGLDGVPSRAKVVVFCLGNTLYKLIEV